jgi:hypothetical protein
LNEHEENIKPVGKKHGIQNKIKDYIDDLINDKNISIPKKIKRQVFDHNKRSDVCNFINENGYHRNIERNEFFTF